MDVELAQRLAFSEGWWTSADRRVRSAFTRTHMRHWFPLVRKALEANRAKARWPQSLPALAQLLGRDPRNVARWTKAAYSLTLQDVAGLAVALDIPVGEFFPGNIEWIAAVTVELSDPRASIEHARAYALYRQAAPRFFNPHLDPLALEKVLKKTDGVFRSLAEAENAIMSVARSLGGLLIDLKESRDAAVRR